MILSGEEKSWGELLDHLRENPAAGLDDTLTLVERDLRGAAKKGLKDSVAPRRREFGRFLDRLLADETLSAQVRDEASWHAPLRWAKSRLKRDYPVIEIKHGSRVYEIPRRAANAAAAAYQLSTLPLTIMRTLAHELGHAMAAKLVGAQVIKFRIFPSGNGYILTPRAPGGWKSALIFLAGPLSQMFWGGVLLLIGFGLLSGGSWAGLAWLLAARQFLDGAIAGGGATDWPGAVKALGFERLSHEMRRRWSDPEEKRYVRMLLRLVRETARSSKRGCAALGEATPEAVLSR
jgi:hypothetical protein